MQGVLHLVGRLLAPMEAVKAVFVITLLATHFSIAYDKPIAVLLQAEYIRGWQLRVVMLLEKVRSLHVAAAFSIVYSQVLSAVLRIKPVRQALGEQACTEVLNAWRCSRPYLLAAAASQMQQWRAVCVQQGTRLPCNSSSSSRTGCRHWWQQPAGQTTRFCRCITTCSTCKESWSVLRPWNTGSALSRCECGQWRLRCVVCQLGLQVWVVATGTY